MKEQLREQLKGERATLPADQRKAWNTKISNNLIEWPAYQKAKRVMVYLSIGWEIHTWNLVADMTSRGVEVYVPVVQKNPHRLIPTLFQGKDKLIPADFGILEPGPDAPIIEPEALDLVIVPGLAFTPEGYRIGFGGGFYDRFLPTTSALKIGLCYHDFIRELPVEPWDKPVDFIATEKGIRGRK